MSDRKDDAQNWDYDWLYRHSDSAGGPAAPSDPGDFSATEPTIKMPNGSQPPGPSQGAPLPPTAPQPQVWGQTPPSNQWGPPPSQPAAPPPGAYPNGWEQTPQQVPVASQPYPPPPVGVPPAAPVKRRKKRHPIRRTLLILLLAWIVFLVATPVHALYESTKVDAMPEGDRPAPQPGTAILLVGSDSREGLTAKQKKKLGTGSISGRRTDTMMLLYSPPSGEPALISLPRDSFVRIPGRGKNKLNAAYAFGGPQLLIKTIEHNTGVRIDGYVEIGFGGFAGVVDAVGGVQVCPEKRIKDRDSHLNLPAGCQTLDGATALGYVRMRKADPRGDLGRMERQREVTGKIVKKVASPMSIINPVRYWELWHAGMSSLNRADETGIVQLGVLGMSLRSISTGNGHTLTVPISNANARTSAGSSVIWNRKKAKQMFGSIREGSTDGFEQYAKR